jgi:histidine triad (HIT) family protein
VNGPAAPSESVRQTPPATNSGCHFCQRVADPGPLRERLVFENDLFHISHQLEEKGPTVLGILLLQTKRHAPGMAELTDLEARQLGSLVQRTSRALKECTGALWTYVFSFTEAYRHVHVVIAARYPDLPPQFLRLAIADWPGAPKGGPSEVAALARRIRERMSSFPALEVG